MALSDWDVLMMNEQGKPTKALFTSPKGVQVEIYKNWIHIHDEKAWIGEGLFAYTKPIVMKIEEGKLDYKDIEIVAIRGPQNGVYVAVWSTIWVKDNEYPKIIGCLGCGVSGYTRNGRYVGVTKSSLRWFIREINKKEIEEMVIHESPRGVSKRWTTKVIPVKVNVYDIPDELKKLNLLKGQRYNLGDAFFTGATGASLQNSKPGKAAATTMSKIIKSLKDKYR